MGSTQTDEVCVEALSCAMNSKTLLHIGLGKAGSSVLKTWFMAHPQLLFKPSAIGGFHHTGGILQLATSRNGQAPKYYVTSEEALSHASPATPEVHLEPLIFHEPALRESQERVCSILHDLFPTARILIVTRGLKQIVRSGYSEYVKSGGTLSFPSFVQAFEAPIRQFTDINSLLRLYGDRFGAANLMVLPYELLRDDPGRFLMLIESWLGIDHHEFNLARVNVSLTPQELYWYPRVSSAIASCARKLKKPYAQKLYRLYVSRCIRKNRLRPLVRALSFFKKGYIGEEDCPPEFLASLKENVTVLKTNFLYTPYAAEYCWE